jgi:hypothetical protein
MMKLKLRNIMGGVCIVFAIIALSLVLLLKFSNEYKNRTPGVLSETIYRVTLIFDKREYNGEMVIQEAHCVVTEKGERLIVAVTIAILSFLSFLSGVTYEKIKGRSTWIPGGILLSSYSLLLVYPILAVAGTLITFLLILKIREKRNSYVSVENIEDLSI